MATLTVLNFASAEGADSALAGLMMRPASDRNFFILDAATVSWPKARSRPGTRQAPPATCKARLDNVFWGMLFGLIFFMPVLVEPLSAAAAALNNLLSDVGIDDTFVYHVRSKITEGRSALFILSSDSVADWTFEACKDMQPELFATYLPGEEEAKLRSLFAKTEAEFFSTTCAR
jgi:uncharacterized membrane protein